MDGGDATAILFGMTGVLARIPTTLSDMAEPEPGVTTTLLKQHVQLPSFIQDQAPGRG